MSVFSSYKACYLISANSGFNEMEMRALVIITDRMSAIASGEWTWRKRKQMNPTVRASR